MTTAWHVPLRLATGAYILNSGIGKKDAEDDRAKALQEEAQAGFPSLGRLEPRTFVGLLSKAEITLGAALLAPFVPAGVAGVALTGLAGGLLWMYWKTPEVHMPGNPRPVGKGVCLAKDSWLFSIGLALAIDAASGRRK